MTVSVLLNITVSRMVEELLSSSDEFDDDDDEVILLLGFKACFQRNIGLRPRVQNYVENVVTLYSDYEFKSHFRITRVTFHFLLGLLHPYLLKKITQHGTGRNTITPEKQLLLAIWVFATPDSYRSVCDRFDVGRATAVLSVRRVTRALLMIRSQFIKWPEPHEVQNIYNNFVHKARFPYVIRVIDDTQIKISAPKDNPEAYVNRSSFHSIQLQVVCDHTRKFIHCYVGHPGSVHDQRVFRLSGLQDICAIDENFPQDSHLLGDSAYMIQKHVLVPFKDNGRLTPRQRNFNFCLSSTRMIIERSIGLLKGRFRSLLDRLPMKRTDLIPNHIMACCVLHNICLIRNDLIDAPLIVERHIDQGVAGEMVDPILRLEGIQKRNRIMANLRMRNV